MTTIRLREEALEWREIEGEIVALDVRRSRYLAINESGTALWPTLAGGSTTDQLVTRLADAFGLDRRRAQADVEAFLAELREQELLEEQEQP